MRSFAVQRVTDVREALTTMPDARSWLACALVFVLFIVCAGPIGLLSGFLRPSAPPLAAFDVLTTAALVFIQPALLEEIVFRGLLLPRDSRSLPRRRLLAIAVVALSLYVASHPLNAMLFRPGVLHVFASPVYLLLAALLGIACTTAYLVSKSIWPPVVIHWVSVLVWLWFLGGQALMMRT
jgi:predicted Abi (CAAX) family protease